MFNRLQTIKAFRMNYRTGMKLPFFLFALSFALASCTSPDIQQYQNAQPKLDLIRYFSGTTDAWGIFQKRNGSVLKRFHVEIVGTHDYDKLILDEHFKYDNGTTQERIWTLRQDAAGRWHGTAADVVGEALGTVVGNALHWQYTLRVPVNGSQYDMQLDDWMYLMDDQSMLNRSSMRKFGVELGQITLFFHKRI